MQVRSLEKVIFLQFLHGTILILTSKQHLGQIQYTIYMEFVTRTRYRKNKFKLWKNLPPTYKIHQFQTMEKNCHISSVFFSTNHQNYARWMTLCWSEFMSLHEENPILKKVT